MMQTEVLWKDGAKKIPQDTHASHQLLATDHLKRNAIVAELRRWDAIAKMLQLGNVFDLINSYIALGRRTV